MVWDEVGPDCIDSLMMTQRRMRTPTTAEVVEDEAKRHICICVLRLRPAFHLRDLLMMMRIFMSLSHICRKSEA